MNPYLRRAFLYQREIAVASVLTIAAIVLLGSGRSSSQTANPGPVAAITPKPMK